jgi:hypothetical protein
MSEPVTTQQSFAPEIVQRVHLCIIFYMYYILINFNILQFNNLTYCNGPLPLNGRLVTDVISAATAMHCDWVEAFHR